MCVCTNLLCSGSLCSGSSLSNLSLRSFFALSYNLYGNLNLYLLVEMDCCLILANALDVVHGDDLTINIEALLLELVSYGVLVNRTVSSTCGTYLSSDNKLNTLKSLSLLLCLSLQSCELVSLLLEVFSEDFLCRF